jgi:N-acetyl-gamma-glutamylphosphate reductase
VIQGDELLLHISVIQEPELRGLVIVVCVPGRSTIQEPDLVIVALPHQISMIQEPELLELVIDASTIQ